MSDRESLLRLADNIASHGANITYPSRQAAHEVRNVVRELAAALRSLPQSAPALSPSQQAERLPSSDAAEAGADADDPVKAAHEHLKAGINHLYSEGTPVPIGFHRAAHALHYAISGREKS